MQHDHGAAIGDYVCLIPSRPHFRDNHSPGTAAMAQLKGHCALLAPSAAGHRRGCTCLFCSIPKACVVSETCKEARTDASQGCGCFRACVTLEHGSGEGEQCPAKYPLEAGRTVHFEMTWQCAAHTHRSRCLEFWAAGLAQVPALSRTSHLVFCRLVPMCGFQYGDELSVLGVGPAANAWGEKTIG